MISRERLTNPRPRQWHPDTPGVSVPWLARANGVSVRTMERQRAALPPAPAPETVSIELAVRMALIRAPGGMMPASSRMAIAALAADGITYNELREKFRCSRNTVWRCVKQWPSGFDPLSWQRKTTAEQQRFEN